MDTKLEAPGQIRHLGWRQTTIGYSEWGYRYQIEWSYEAPTGEPHALLDEFNAYDAQAGMTPEKLEADFITRLNWLYRTGQMLQSIPRETEPFVRFNNDGQYEEILLECPPTN